MRVIDSITLAYTKLRTRKVRTAISVGISGVLFGCLLGVVIILQGIFSSIESFGKEGLGSRYLVYVTRSSRQLVNTEQYMTNTDFIAKVKDAYKQGVAERVAEAKRLGIPYDAAADPSPIVIDKETKQESIEWEGLSHWAVKPLLREIAVANKQPFDVAALAKPFSPKTIFASEYYIAPTTGAVTYMRGGSEQFPSVDKPIDTNLQKSGFGWLGDDNEPKLSVMPQDIAQPYITDKSYQPSSGSIPAVVPFVHAEKLLGLKPLKASATNQQRLDRIKQVHAQAMGKTASFCYRNITSQGLIHTAQLIDKEARQNNQKPKVTYALPDKDSCGPVTIATDTRTATEKALVEKQLEFDKKFNGFVDPEQHKLTVQVVGLSANNQQGSFSTISMLATGLLTTPLSMSGSWVIPDGWLERVASDKRPDAIFARSAGESEMFYDNPTSVLVEFHNTTDAQQFLKKYGNVSDYSDIWALPISSSLVVAELKRYMTDIVFWIVMVISAIAALIMTGTVGRTIADGRKETAVFRALGARRLDIVRIYMTYALLLSLRVVVFAFVLGMLFALGAQLWAGADATIGAQIAFSSTDFDKQFLLFGFDSWYIPAIIGAIVAAGLIALILPLLRNIRRNPIHDMRDDM